MEKKKEFVRKNGNQFGGSLYKWTPTSNHKDKPLKVVVNENYNGGADFCHAPLNGQGVDNKTTYSYSIFMVGGGLIKNPYTQCDYVM